MFIEIRLSQKCTFSSQKTLLKFSTGSYATSIHYTFYSKRKTLTRKISFLTLWKWDTLVRTGTYRTI